LLVTHDDDVAAAATRIVRMRDGRIEDDGASGRSTLTATAGATTAGATTAGATGSSTPSTTG
jgi:ABC-type sulfate/molybdate transport systems ATPase subunit